MKDSASATRRLAHFLRLLPEVCANSARFRVPFLLPRWFSMPQRVRVANRSVPLRYPREAGVDADFITCVLRNNYGLGRKLSDVATVVDVGANLGFFSLAVRAHYPAAAIHAYEPNPRILPFLRSNAADIQVQIHPEAVGAAAGTVGLIDDGPSNQARIHAVGHSTHPRCKVRQVNLATVLERAGGRIDLLKLDCEGAEWEILQPGPCWDSIRNVRLEYHLVPGQQAHQASRALAELGFSILYARHHDEKSGIIWAART